MIRNRSEADGPMTRRRLLNGAAATSGLIAGSGLLKGFPAVLAQNSKQAMAASADFALTPRGPRHRSLIHSVAGGSHIVNQQGKRKIIAPNGAATEIAEADATVLTSLPAVNGWQSFAYWYNLSPAAITVFETTWIVPPAPKTNSGQLIYLFNALETAAGDHILQPVLQWGVSPAPNSSPNWGIASWWVGSGNSPSFITDLVPVKVGDKLVGRMTMISYDDKTGTCTYTCEFVGVSETLITAENLPQLRLCTETLEVYNVTGNSDYPGTNETVFGNISLQPNGLPSPLPWTATGAFAPALVPVTGGGVEVHIVYPTT